MNRRRATIGLSTLLLAGTLSACGNGAPSTQNDNGSMRVAAAFYPLQFAAEQIGGTGVSVTSLTKPGAEPHDLELTPRDVAGLGDASIIIYEKNFQPAVDDAVAQVGAKSGFDVSAAAKLTLAATDDGHDHAEADHAEADHAEGDHAEGEEHAAAPASATTGAVDPHFWLDPTRYAAVATAIGEKFAELDPANAATYTTNAKSFVARLTALDAEFKTGLANCAVTDLVTGHAAFGYLAERYGFHQEGIAGISPDVEPNAAAMQELIAHVTEAKATTVYAETLVSPALAETIARDSGAKVAVLDPLEGITDKSAGTDYFSVMKANLATLKAGQSCR